MENEKIIREIETAKNEAFDIIEAARRCLGLKYLSYVAITFPIPKSHSLPIHASNYPMEWQNRYIEQDYVKSDPAVIGALDSLVPVDWSGLDRSAAIAKKLFGEARAFGICCGLSLPIRGSNGGIAIVTAATDSSVRDWEDYKRENIRKIDVASVLLHRKILGLHRVADQRPKLTRRETECLTWTSQGKTCADVAEILSISENTARSYLTSARNKLNCLTIAHCVAKAISMQIIPPVV